MPPDRLLEARKTYAEIAAASQSLSESAKAAEESIAAVEAQARKSCDTLNAEIQQAQIAASYLTWVLQRPLWVLFVAMILSSFLGAWLSAAARIFTEWLLQLFLTWWAG